MATLRLTPDAILTTDHPASSYGLPVLVMTDGRVIGPNDPMSPATDQSGQDFVTACDVPGAEDYSAGRKLDPEQIPEIVKAYLRQANPKTVISLQWIGPPAPPEPEELRAWREEQGLTQTQCSIIAGVDISTWQRWEYGDRAVPQWLASVLRDRYGSAP